MRHFRPVAEPVEKRKQVRLRTVEGRVPPSQTVEGTVEEEPRVQRSGEQERRPERPAPPRLVRETLPPYRVESRIPVHLDAHDRVLDELVDLHAAVGAAHGAQLAQDDDRGAAMWELAGHALGLAKAYVGLLRIGSIPADMVIARSLHETLLSLEAVSDPANRPIIDRYLSGQDLKAESLRKAVRATQRRANAAGAQIDGDPQQLALALYRGLSGYAHVKRTTIRDAIPADPPGTFAFGPHPDVYMRANHVSSAGALLVQAVLAVTSSMSGAPGFEDSFGTLGLRLARELKELDARYPLGVPAD
jgi:hypothetical protein